MDLGLLVLIVGLMTIAFIVVGMSTHPSVQNSTTLEAQENSRKQIVEDIKMTKTSRVVDEVSILDELDATAPGFRQYCELTGTSQREGGVIAPYSRKEVAYYEIRCYRIDNNGTRDVETLIAHEKSFDPFYFTDASCETPVFVNIDSFGDNVILINSTNHIEGPNSEFAKAMSEQSANAGGYTANVSNMVGRLASGIVHGFGRAREAVRGLLEGLVPAPAFAFAGAGGAVVAGLGSGLGQEGWAKNFSFGASNRSSGGFSGGQSSKQGGSGKRSGGRSGRPSVNVPSSGLGDFFGASRPSGGFSSVPRPTVRPQQMPRPVAPMPRPVYPRTYRRVYGGSVLDDMLTGMMLSTVLDSMQTSTQATTPKPTSTFRGYRLVEDVVPLGNPIYCIGEIYHNGTDVYMGRSLADGYATSYFATKPEAEVVEALSR